MPSYNFKPRFVPMVKEGSKNQTIRARPKNGRTPKMGDMLYLFSGLRTKFTTRLLTTPLKAVKGIYIDENRIIIYDRPLDDQEMFLAKHLPFNKNLPGPHELTILKDQFAWLDGFRPDGSTFESPTGSFDLMLKFWRLTHDLPFVGDLIYWDGKDKR